jgi:threonine aldolase
VHPFDDHNFIAGHATMGLEILEDAPDVAAVIGGVGGGGLVTGVGSAVKAVKPGIQVWTAEPETAAPAARSFAAGSPQAFPEWQASFVDGAGGQSLFPRMWERLKPVVDGNIVVSLDQTRRAMRLMAEKARVIAEGAGALPLAAALTGAAGQGPIVAIVSGGNVDLARSARSSRRRRADCIVARYDFASDNTAPATPEAMAALNAANAGFASGYGTDAVSARAADLLRGWLDADAEVRFVASGTAANAIALAALCRPFESVLAHEHAHILTDEAGAPGLFGHGLGLTPLPGASGRIDPAALIAALAQPDVSYRQPAAALSLTNATEYGTVYSPAELAALTGPAKAAGLGVHLDGARLANAAAAGFDVKAIAGLGVDVLVVGGTKSGMPPSEAVVIFDRALARRFDSRLKTGRPATLPRAGSSPPRSSACLRKTPSCAHAAHANAMARRLAAVSPFATTHPVEANGVFVAMDDDRLAALQADGWFVYRFLDGSVRFMCSWATTAEAVDEIGEALRRLA